MQEHKIKIRITSKLNFDNDERLKRLQEKKKEVVKEKEKTVNCYIIYLNLLILFYFHFILF